MRITCRILVGLMFLGLLIFRPTTSYAWHDGWHGHSYVGVEIGAWPGSYYYGYPYEPYYGYPYYPAYPVQVSSYQPVVVNGATYYLNNGTYYTYTQYGYQVLATPPAGAPVPVVQAAVVATAPVVTGDDTFSVNVPNNKGGYTAVVLKKSGNGFIGPQGEFYADFPKVSQLQLMYGK